MSNNNNKIKRKAPNILKVKSICLQRVGHDWVTEEPQQREARGGMNWESSIETYTLPYVKLECQWKVYCMMPGAQIWCSVTT